MLCGGSGVGAKSHLGGVGSKWAEPTAGWAEPAAGGRILRLVGGACCGMVDSWPTHATRQSHTRTFPISETERIRARDDSAQRPRLDSRLSSTINTTAESSRYT